MVLVDFRFSPLVLYKRKNLPQARITVPVAFHFSGEITAFAVGLRASRQISQPCRLVRARRLRLPA